MPRIVTPPPGSVPRLSLNRSSEFANGLQGWWPSSAAQSVGTKILRDLSGYGADGIIDDAPTFRASPTGTGFPTAPSPQSVKFIGASSSGEGVDVPGYSTGMTSAVTVASWIRFYGDNFASMVDMWFKKNRPGGTDVSFALLTYSNRVFRFTVEDGTGHQDFSSGFTLTSGYWWHTVGTYDGASAKLYVNGELKSTHSHSNALTGGAEPIAIGYKPGAGSSPQTPDVEITDTRIWSRTLSTPAVWRLYRETLRGYGSLATQPRIFWDPAEGAAAVAQSAPILLATTQAGL